MFNIRASYYEEAAGIISHFWEYGSLEKLLSYIKMMILVHQKLKGVELALAKYKSEPVSRASYERGTENVSPALKTIRQANPEAVVIIGVYAPTARFIMGAKWSGLIPISTVSHLLVLINWLIC